MILIVGLFVAVLSPGIYSLYPTSSDVVDLTPSNFDSLVIRSDNVWIVEFYAPWCGHCQQFVPEFSKAASALKGVVKVGAVNADQHHSLGGQYGVKGFPTIKIFGADKSKPEDYSGPRTAKGLVDAAISSARSYVNSKLTGKKSSGRESKSDSDGKDVIELTDDNFDDLVLGSKDMWLVEFYAPWCGHCKNLAPHWAQAASELKGKVKLGALDATVHSSKSNEYGVSGYPTIKMFPSGKKDSSSAVDYNGGRTSSDIVEWALQKLSENVAAPPVLQIVSDKVLKDACEGHSLCVVSVLPHILDCQSDCRNSYLKILNVSADNYKRNLWGWVWSEAGAQPELEETLEIGGFGYPAMAVMNTKKMKFSLLRGSFSQEGIHEFLRDLSIGRGSTAPVRGASLPPARDTEPWDGKDGELPEEEDLDLNDVELDDLPKDEL